MESGWRVSGEWVENGWRVPCEPTMYLMAYIYIYIYIYVLGVCTSAGTHMAVVHTLH